MKQKYASITVNDKSGLHLQVVLVLHMHNYKFPLLGLYLMSNFYWFTCGVCLFLLFSSSPNAMSY